MKDSAYRSGKRRHSLEMPFPLRIATFNCENLFRRSKILHLQDKGQSSALLDRVSKLQALLENTDYSETMKQQIFEISCALHGFIDLRIDSGSLGAWTKDKNSGSTGFRVYKSCAGRTAWTGQIVFLDEPFQDLQRQNTARVIAATAADVLCAVEVEGMDALGKFNKEALHNQYDQYISIDSPNDPRGIDVACLSKYPVLGIKTHVFDGYGDFRRVFSRDCLEVELDLGKTVLHVLCNHFKSQRASFPEEAERSAAKRRAQAGRVAAILQQQYRLDRDWVVVLGDLNEDPASPYRSLQPLFDCPDLKPVVNPAASPLQRYTYYYAKGKKDERLSQLDYIFVSTPLARGLKSFGFVREGIFGIDKAAAAAGADPVNVYDTVTDWNLSASDHAALWAQFEL